MPVSVVIPNDNCSVFVPAALKSAFEHDRLRGLASLTPFLRLSGSRLHAGNWMPSRRDAPRSVVTWPPTPAYIAGRPLRRFCRRVRRRLNEAEPTI